MNTRLSCLSALILMAAIFLFAGCSQEPEKAPVQEPEKNQFLAFGGGPTGGTFNFFANKMSSIISADYDWLNISPKGSGGSAENLRSLNRNAIDFGISYSGDAFLARNGKLPNDATQFTNVTALSYLYGAPAQLIVRKDGGIADISELKGKTVAVGNPGSGAALSAERFLKHLGLWDTITVRNFGYSKAAQEFIAGRIDAFWVLVGYPNASVIEASSRFPITLLDLDAPAVKSGFYEAYPFYSRETVPAGTYQGLDSEVATFQDAALWCANKGLSDRVVFDALKAIYSAKGLKAMSTAHKAATGMSINNGVRSIPIALHPGAARFWQEMGIDIPATILP